MAKMNSSSVSGSQKKIRKSLRNRRVSAPFAQPKKNKQDVIQQKIKHGKLVARKDIIRTPTHAKLVARNDIIGTPTQALESFGTADSGQNKNNIVEASEILLGNAVNRKLIFNAEPANRNEYIGENTSAEVPVTLQCDRKENDRMENQRSDNDSDTEMDFVVNENGNSVDENNRSEISESPATEEQSDEDLQNDLKDSESEDLEENCIESVLKDFSKDIGALYSKTNRIESDLKEIKEMLKARQPKNCIRTISSRIKQKSAFSLLPKFPLRKKAAVRKMQADIEDEDDDYKDQLIKKLASFGGDTVNEIVINIFKKLFSSKLKTKYCWKGSLKGKGKLAFRDLTGIIEVIWSAVLIHFEDCTEVMINKEIKLRLNQAQKDYDREMEKNKKSD